MKREPITFTQALMADLEIRQGARRGEVAGVEAALRARGVA